MKNVLYIGQYKDNSGFGASCRRFVDCIASNQNINLSTRPIFIYDNAVAPYESSDQYIEYENNNSKKYDIFIQQIYPDFIEYHKNFGKNIAILEIETRYIKHTGWVDKLNMMDEVWVGSVYAAQNAYESGVKATIKIVPEPYVLSKFTNEHNSFFTYDSNDRPFIFYTIGQYAEKKNIKNIIFAYLLEFNKKDNVKLFIKTCDHRQQNNDLEQLIKFDMINMKNMIRKYNNYADIDVVCGYLSKTDIVRLHQSSDCYINAVKGDSFGSSAIESALCDKLIINTKNIGSSTYFNSSNALMVDCYESSVTCSNPPVKNAYTIYETWMEPSIHSIREQMRKAYDMKTNEKKTLQSNFNKNLFSHENLYQLIS